MHTARKSIIALCLMAANAAHPQSALPAAGEAEYQRLMAAVSASIREVEQGLAPLGQAVQEVRQRIDRTIAQRQRCRQQIEAREARFEFVSERLGNGSGSGRITIGNKSYSQAELNNAIDEQNRRIAGEHRQCEQNAAALESARAELDSRMAVYERLESKLEVFERARADLQARWAQAGKQSRIDSLERSLSAGDSLVLASDSELGRALFQLEALVSAKESASGEIRSLQNIDLTQIDLK